MKRQITVIMLFIGILTVISCNAASPTPPIDITSTPEELTVIVTETNTATVTSVVPRIVTTTTDYRPIVITPKTTTWITQRTTISTIATPSTTIITPTTTTATTTRPTTNIGEYTEAIVVRIIDGDTIDVEMSGKIYPVRYIGIDTPEVDDVRPVYKSLALSATEHNRQLLAGKHVKLVKDISEADIYKRLLRYVYVDDIFVNAELVKSGYAKAERFEPDVKYQDYFEQLETEAKQSGVGMWGVGMPDIHIDYIFFDGIKKNEPDEYVEISNTGTAAQELSGWVLKDLEDSKQKFTFSSSFTLKPGAVIRVYTNEIHIEYGGFSFGKSSSIWNNSEPDIAVLYDNYGNEISRLSY
jgi:micrococcal nuclease